MHEKLEKKTEESIKKILDEGITTNNLDYLYKLTKINCMAKKGENDMNYENYYEGRRAGYDNYGRDEYGRYGNYNRDSYGRRGYDMRYRGEEELDRMHGEYGRYMENRERYGAGAESDKSFHYMIEAYKDFTKVLFEQAETPQQKQMLREAIQESMR